MCERVRERVYLLTEKGPDREPKGGLTEKDFFSPSGHFFMRLTEKIYLITLLKSGLTEKGKGGREEGRRRN